MNIPSDQNKIFTRKLALRAEETDQVLFDSHWMTVQETAHHYHRLKRDSTLKVAELTIFFMLILFGAMMPFAILALLGGIVG
jgi:hypothetical protein